VLSNSKILLTGATGQIGGALCRYLAPRNDMWCVARFGREGSREQVEASGASTRVVDLEDPDFSGLPEDFDFVLHLAAFLDPRDDYDLALRTSAESTALLLGRFRAAKAALVMSTTGVYRPHEDPHHLFREGDPLGDARNPSIPTYAIAKISEEAVARSCARLFDLPVVVARMNSAYGHAGLPMKHLQRILAGEAVRLRWDPAPYSPIFERDIAEQVEAMLSAASVPATVINWGGDVPVTAQQWCSYLGELSGREPVIEVVPVPGSQRGVGLDVTRRVALTGPSSTDWRTGMRWMYDRHVGASA
jgi:UDP-glucuronate 4-epimerase